MEKDVFLVKEELIHFEQIAELSYIRNLIVLIMTIIFCFFLFQVVWRWVPPPRSIKDYRHLWAIKNTPNQYRKQEIDYHIPSGHESIQNQYTFMCISTKRQWKNHSVAEREEAIVDLLLICPLNIKIWMDHVYVEGLLSMQAREAFSSKPSETSLLVWN